MQATPRATSSCFFECGRSKACLEHYEHLSLVCVCVCVPYWNPFSRLLLLLSPASLSLTHRCQVASSSSSSSFYRARQFQLAPPPRNLGRSSSLRLSVRHSSHFHSLAHLRQILFLAFSLFSMSITFAKHNHQAYS